MARPADLAGWLRQGQPLATAIVAAAGAQLREVVQEGPAHADNARTSC